MIVQHELHPGGQAVAKLETSSPTACGVLLVSLCCVTLPVVSLCLYWVEVAYMVLSWVPAGREPDTEQNSAAVLDNKLKVAMETRWRRAVNEKASAVPPEVWQLIVSFLDPSEAVRAAVVCSEFASIATPAAQQACRRLWPQHAARLAACGAKGVQRFLRLVQAHEEEVAVHPDVGKSKSVQKVVCSEHRQIAVEWLVEVSWDWQLESTVVYRGAQYLDHYLAAHPVSALSKFQMLAISCLRVALKHSNKLAERERQRLPCRHWAEVTDGAATEAEVRNQCTKLERLLQQEHRSHPNAKQRLRYLWYRLFDAGVVKQEHVYIYMLASFLLHLSLLDSSLSAVTPSKLATAALGLSLRVFGFPPMPAVLAEHTFYLPAELQEVQQQLERVQEEVAGSQLRALWVTSYSYSGVTSQQAAYALLERIVTNPGKLEYLPQAEESSSTTQQEAQDAAAAPAAACEASGTASAVDAAAPAPPAATAAEAASASAGLAWLVNRVVTRAAAAAGLASGPVAGPPAAAAAAGTAGPVDHKHAARSSAGSSSSHAGSSMARPAVAPAALTEAEQAAALATPQRPSAGTSHAAAAVMGPPPGMAAAAGHTPAATTPAAATAVAAIAGQHDGADDGLQLPGSGCGSARRGTRELPPRRAVAVSRYGMLASRGSTPARGAAAAADVPSSSKAGSSHVGVATAVAAARQHSEPGSTLGVMPGQAAAAAQPAGMRTDGMGMSRAAPAAAFCGPPGSMTPASPKHAAAGTRGLAALFAGVGHGGTGSSQAGVGSSTGRLLSGLPSLQGKLNAGDSVDLQQRLSEEPSWLSIHQWSLHQSEIGSFSDQAGSSKAGHGSSGSHLHKGSVPVLRSARRSGSAGGAGGPASAQDHAQKAHALQARPGVHTRSSSGGSSADATSSHWHNLPHASAARTSQALHQH